MPFDLHPDLARDSLPLGRFDLCEARMMDDAAYPWFLLVPQKADLRDTIDLIAADHAKLWEESRTFSLALMRAFAGEKLNVAALGNMTPQLHIHHVVRYTADPAWPGPIWGVVPMQPLDADAIAARHAKLREHLPETFIWRI